MCTLTLAWQAFDDVPVAVAANRDEALERPSSPPDVYREDPLVVAPSDASAGGTWIGYNEFGLFAGITNRWTETDLEGTRSRGLLVADVLNSESVTEASEIVETAVENREYAGFNLVVADAEKAICYAWDGELTRHEFDPGVHVVVNVAIDDDVDIPSVRTEAARTQATNARVIRDELDIRPGEQASDWLSRASQVLRDHEYGVCIHRDGFGTKSSSLLSLGDQPWYAFADGPPCRTPYEPVGSEGHI